MYVEAEFTWKNFKEAQRSDMSVQLRDVCKSCHLGLGAVRELTFLL